MTNQTCLTDKLLCHIVEQGYIYIVLFQVWLSVCLLARLLKNACMNLDDILHVDRCLDMD